jgi:hypothetical protein
LARRPISAPRDRTSGFTRCAGSPVAGSTVMVVPRASLLWNPRPPLRYSSVVAVGAKTSDAYGHAIAALRRPEFSGRSLGISKV